MTLIRFAEETAHAFNAAPFIAGGTALAVFFLLGIVTWSYRDIANRHSHKTGASGSHGTHDSHSAGH